MGEYEQTWSNKKLFGLKRGKQEMGRASDALSKLSRANCLTESLYKSISNWHKSLIRCSTSRTNSRSEGGEITFL